MDTLKFYNFIYTFCNKFWNSDTLHNFRCNKPADEGDISLMDRTKDWKKKNKNLTMKKKKRKRRQWWRYTWWWWWWRRPWRWYGKGCTKCGTIIIVPFFKHPLLVYIDDEKGQDQTAISSETISKVEQGLPKKIYSCAKIYQRNETLYTTTIYYQFIGIEVRKTIIFIYLYTICVTCVLGWASGLVPLVHTFVYYHHNNNSFIDRQTDTSIKTNSNINSITIIFMRFVYSFAIYEYI